mgnify:FL=1|tara:strand:- start:219 stop:767 length:549 start_codon:yes stop_codon:yes gene_type:complete
MCSVPAAMFGMQAISQIGAANEKNAAIQDSMNSVDSSMNRQLQASARRKRQEEIAAESKINSLIEQADQAKSETLLSALEKGAGGGAQDDILIEYTRGLGRQETEIRRQFAYGIQEKSFQDEEIIMAAKNKQRELLSQATTSGQLNIGLAQSALGAHMMGGQAGYYDVAETNFFSNPFNVLG